MNEAIVKYLDDYKRITDYIVVRAKDSEQIHKLSFADILRQPNNFFTGLLDFIKYDKQSSKEIDVIVLDEEPKILNEIVKFLCMSDNYECRLSYTLSYSKLLDRAQYYCLDTLEQMIKQKKNREEGIIIQPLDIQVYNYDTEFTEDNNFKKIHKFSLIAGETFSTPREIGRCTMNITQRARIPTEQNNKKIIEISLYCYGHNCFDITPFIFNTLRIELRNKKNKLIKRIDNCVFWEGNREVKLGEIDYNEIDYSDNDMLKFSIKYYVSGFT